MVQGYCTEEVVKWALNYAEPSNQIRVPMSRHEGASQEKGPLGRRLQLHIHIYSAVLISMCCNRCPLCPSTLMSTRRCCLETILAAMNHG
jgi:hypothetical protein